MLNLSTKETKAKFNKSSKDLNFKLKGNKNFIVYMKEYINNDENLRKKTY